MATSFTSAGVALSYLRVRGTWAVAVAALITGVALAFPAFAAAATAETEGVTAVFRGSAGEANNVVIGGGGLNPVEFEERAVGISPGTGCLSLSSMLVRCEARNADIYLGNEDDQAFSGLSTLIFSGDMRVFGGPGDDSLMVGSFGGSTEVFGQAGNDHIQAAGDGNQVADGGPGNDVVSTGGVSGFDIGRGGPGNDTISFFVDDSGIADLEGGRGNDRIFADPGGLPGSTASGGPGDDIIFGGVDPLRSPDSPGYTLNGDSGNDQIFGGGFDDIVNGGEGNDTIDVAGGGADTVDCGSGIDTVRYDASDTISPDCETRILVL